MKKTNTETKRTIVMSLVADLPFELRFTSRDKTYLELSNFTDGTKDSDYTTVRKAYPTSRPEEIKIYLDEIKFIVMDASNIKFTAVVPEAKKPEAKAETLMDRYELLKTCVSQDLPVYLYGPAGTGKSYSLQEVAFELNLDFYSTNSVQQEYKLTGFIGSDGKTYVETEFYKAFTKGGLFFLDELDASSPDVLVLLNTAVAQRYFEFPNGRVSAHPDFRIVAAGNTVGTGSTEQYTGRMPIDQSSLDRFIFIAWDYDPTVELKLAEGDTDLCLFIHSLRKANLNTTFSYRAIIATRKLVNAGVPLDTIIVVAVLKGLSKDAINSIRRPIEDSANPYFAVLQKIQRAA